MEIKKKLFESGSETEDLSTEIICTESTLYYVAKLYDQFVKDYSGKTVFFIPKNAKPETKEKKLTQLKQFVEKSVEAGLPINVFMKAQFETLKYMFKKLGYVPVNAMIGDQSVQRARDYVSKMQSKRITTQTYDTQRTDLEAAMQTSADKFYLRLTKLQEALERRPTEEEAVRELAMLTRLGFLSKVFVYCSPLPVDGVSELAKVKQEVKLDKYQEESLQLIKRALVATNRDWLWRQYVIGE